MNFAKCLRTPFFLQNTFGDCFCHWSPSFLLLSFFLIPSPRITFSFLLSLCVTAGWPVFHQFYCLEYSTFVFFFYELNCLHYSLTLIFICYKFNCLYNSVFLSSGGTVSFTYFCINNSCSFSNALIWSERVLRLLLMFSLCIAFPFRYLWYLLPGTSCIYNFCYSNRFLIWLTTSFSSSPLPSATILFFKLWIWSLLWC